MVWVVENFPGHRRRYPTAAMIDNFLVTSPPAARVVGDIQADQGGTQDRMIWSDFLFRWSAGWIGRYPDDAAPAPSRPVDVKEMYRFFDKFTIGIVGLGRIGRHARTLVFT